MTCKHCGLDCCLRWVTFSNLTRHIEAKCTACGRHNGYAKQTPEAIVEADAAEAGTAATPGLYDAIPETPAEG